MDIKKDFIQCLRGRAEFCRDRGEVKTPELLEHAAQLLEEKAQAVPEVKHLHRVTLTCAQLREAYQFGAPDEDDQEQLETEMTITWSEEGHSGKGYYCYYSELPEEGAIFLGEVIEAQEQKG